MTRPRGFVEHLHASARSGVFVVTGGGSLVLSDLLTVPGASATVLEAVVPYAEAALTEFLGYPAQQACSGATTRAAAMRAFQRAVKLAPGEPHARFGLAITASLRTKAKKRGEHRAFVALQTLDATREWRLHLGKGARTRLSEERLVRDVAFGALGANAPVLEEGERLEHVAATAVPAWQALWTSEDATRALGPVFEPRVIFPGSFNPLHDGHRRIAAFASERLRQPVTFEICITNVDKPPLDCIDLAARLETFAAADSVWLTRVPTFAEKAMVFGGATFLVGIDTIERIADPKYYSGSRRARDAAIATISAAACRFLVFGRLQAGKFVSLADLDLPAALVRLCDGLSEREFRTDVSSTELRNRHGGV